MKPAKIFPIHIKAYETLHYTCNPHRYLNAFLTAYAEQRERSKTWFAFDVIIHSATNVEFVVYDMRSNIYGGIGKETWRCHATVPASLTKPDIDAAIIHAARMRRLAEIEAVENNIIARHAANIRKEMRRTA